MDQEALFTKLEQNPSEVFEETIRLLCKIGENILKNPLDSKIRVLKKSNDTISNKILGVKGGKECLIAMGFEEKPTSFVMSINDTLKHVEEFMESAESWKKRVQQKCTSPTTQSNLFLRSLEMFSNGVLQYKDMVLQERTRKLIPIPILEENAQKRLRLVQTHMKKNNLEDPDISIQDMMILELMQWFKEDFFTWVDSPPCEFCGESTKFSHMSKDPKLLLYTDRVELHRCKSCHKFTPFPRYNDLNILLETRRGRCGEWANTFTLCCHALGWDSRYVVDEGDHVWTEVYSTTQKRWLHCDPCENICDTPLVYESGWNKKISYVMAYSPEEVQDVTWRYSSNHKDVLKRRTACLEAELLQAIFKIRTNLQKNVSPTRKKYLLKRNLMELADFLLEKKAKTDEFRGRISGSEIWRISRGEVQESGTQSQYLWKIKLEDIVDNTVTIRYSAALNKYEYISGSKTIIELMGWENGTFKFEEVFRKEENDWKMVYLARKSSVEKGYVSWKFDFTESTKSLQTVVVQMDQDTYETGIVNVTICTSNTCLTLPKNQLFTTNDFTGSNELIITATLSGGNGDTAWQHAQLFRQSLDSTDCNFSITFTFK